MTVEVCERVSEDVARSALRRAHETVDAAAVSAEAFTKLLLEHRPRWELVYNYGMGTILLVSADEEGNLVWPPDGHGS